MAIKTTPTMKRNTLSIFPIFVFIDTPIGQSVDKYLWIGPAAAVARCGKDVRE